MVDGARFGGCESGFLHQYLDLLSVSLISGCAIHEVEPLDDGDDAGRFVLVEKVFLDENWMTGGKGVVALGEKGNARCVIPVVDDVRHEEDVDGRQCVLEHVGRVKSDATFSLAFSDGALGGLASVGKVDHNPFEMRCLLCQSDQDAVGGPADVGDRFVG